MKKGFTLVELLAVIVILAVIAIIAIPIITNVIDKAKQGALKDSAYGILDSAEMYLAKNINKGIDDTMEFTCNNGKCLSGEEEINYKGKIESGKVRIYTDSKIELCVSDNKSSALKTVANKKVEVATGTCDYGELNYGVTALVSKEALDEANKKYNDLKALVDQTDASVSDVLNGKKIVIDSELVTGTYHGYEIVETGNAQIYLNYDTTGIVNVTFKNTYSADDNVYFYVNDFSPTSGAPYIKLSSFNNKIVGNTLAFVIWNAAGNSSGNGTFTIKYMLLKYK